MNAGGCANDGPIAHRDMSPESDGVSQHAVASHNYVVRHVHVSHKQVVITDYGFQAAALSTAMNGDKLPDPVAIPDVRFGPLAGILQILPGDADGRVWIERVLFADPGRTLAVDMRQ